MPGGDRTGPMGYGPRTGRAAGYCAGYGVPGYANPGGGYGYGYGRGGGFGRGYARGFGRGMGGGFGRGAGYGRGYGRGYGARGRAGWGDVPPPAPAEPYYPYDDPIGSSQELRQLRRDERELKGALDDIKRRISELENRAERSNEG